MADLKPCPFCGGEVSIAAGGEAPEKWFFVTRGHSKTAKNCDCRVFMESGIYYDGYGFPAEVVAKIKNDLIEAWNRRADDGTRDVAP